MNKSSSTAETKTKARKEKPKDRSDITISLDNAVAEEIKKEAQS